MTYTIQRKQADRHTLRAAELIGRSSVVPSSVLMDQRFGTDLYVMDTPTGSVAMRTRTRAALKFDSLDFTIRVRAQFGGDTEIDKVMSGAINRMFYGVLNDNHSDFEWWMFFNLNVLRGAMNKWCDEKARGLNPWPFWQRNENRDGTAFFTFNARNKVFQHPLFMIDCSDSCGYPGRVAYRDLLPANLRPEVATQQPAANDNDLFSTVAA